MRKLTQDMRIQRLRQAGEEDAQMQADFGDYLLRVGEGREPVTSVAGTDYVTVPPDMMLGSAGADHLLSYSSLLLFVLPHAS